MKDFMSLKLLDKFKFLFEKSGIDYEVMRSILKIKLTMDNRRTSTVMTNYNKKDDEKSNAFNSALFMYAFTGLIIAIMVISNMSIFAKMSFTFGIIMFMVLTTMIADFSSVLLDVRDSNILASKPISPKTLSAAKVMHIFIYISKITLAISAFSLIGGTYKHGAIFFVLFLLELILIALFIIFLSAFLYNFILVFFDGEKLKDMINYFQIILSFVMVIGYQLVGDMFRILDFKLEFAPKWWVYIIPPAWFASPFEMLINGDYSRHYIILGLLALLVPALLLIVHFKFVIPNFEKNLSKLLSSSERKNPPGYLKSKIHYTFRNILCINRVERHFYTFTQRMASNERALKLRIYPSLGFAIIMPFIIAFRSYGNIAELSKSKSYFFMYMVITILSSSIIMMTQSERYNGAWIYRVLPVESPVPILKGSFKGFMMKYIVSAYLLASVVFIAIFGSRIIPDLIIIFFAMLLLELVLYRIIKKQLPFSHPFTNTNNSASTAATFAAFGICGGMALVHILIAKLLIGRIIFLLIILVIIAVLWRDNFKVKWADLE